MKKNNWKNQAVRIQGLSVEVTGNFEKSFKIFNKKVQASGILKDLRDREEYMKPSERRRIAKKMAVKRTKKEQGGLDTEF